MRTALVAATLALVACNHGDPIVRSWNDDLDYSVTAGNYRLVVRSCSAAASSNRPGADAVRKRCGAVAYDVVAVVKGRFLPAPPPPYTATMEAVEHQEACRVACAALAFAEKADARYTATADEIATRCGECKRPPPGGAF